MFCRNCGMRLEDDVLFCTRCGVDARAGVTDDESAGKAPAPAAENAEAPAPEAGSWSVRSLSDDAEEPSAVNISAADSSDENSAQPPVFIKDVPEKTTFGVGALIFCLLLIAALSVSTGVFAGMYFSLLAK